MKYPNSHIVEYFTILIIEIGFGENILTKKGRKIKNQRVKIYPHPNLSSGNPIESNQIENTIDSNQTENCESNQVEKCA